MPTFKACGEVETPQLISLLKKVDRRCFGRSPNYFPSPTLSPSLPFYIVYLLPLQGDLQPHQRCEHRSTRRRSEATLRCCSNGSRYRDAAHCSGVRHAKLPISSRQFHSTLARRVLSTHHLDSLGLSRARGLKLRCEESICFIRKQLDLPQVGCKKCFQVCMYVDRNAVGFSCKLL